MADAKLTSVLFVLLLLVTLAQLLGWLFVKLRQPKVVGEILAGIVLGLRKGWPLLMPKVTEPVFCPAPDVPLTT
jgi:Kef-type K+ transport system membrane component KefB